MNKRFFRLILLLALGLLVLLPVATCGGGGDDDDDEEIDEDNPPETLEEILEELTGYNWSFSEGDIGLSTPENWRFLFAVELSSSQSRLLDREWSIDFNAVGDELAKVGRSLSGEGLDQSKIDHQLLFAQIKEIGGQNHLRFANKLTYQNGLMAIDPEAPDLLGQSVGGHGPGWYVAYYSTKPFGFVTGRALPCADADISSATVIATGGAFFARPDQDGAFALPTLQQDSANPFGKPSAVFIDAGACAAAHAFSMVDTRTFENPKCSQEDAPDPCAQPTSSFFPDDTAVAEPITMDLAENAAYPTSADADCQNCDFEAGNAAGWSSFGVGGQEGDPPCFGVQSAGHGQLFPAGPESFYAFLTTGGTGRRSCTAYRTLDVPEDASALAVSYDLATQEYPQWVGSAYTDVFTVAVTGAFSFAVNRTVNNLATGADFTSIPGEARDIAGVNLSQDAAANAGGAVFDGHLRWSDDGAVPRGGALDGGLGKVASFPVTPGDRITLVLFVSDVADLYWDTAALIDYVRFE